MNKRDPQQDSFEAQLEEALDENFDPSKPQPTPKLPEELYVLPLNRRPFFPGMAAPILIEPGPYYEVLKLVAKQEGKYVALVLTKKENANIYKVGFGNLFRVGVLARVLRIIPTEGGGAQVILNMEERIELVEHIKDHKHLRARVRYHPEINLISEELKAYSINIISVIKELLKLNPLFKEELQIFSWPLRFYRARKACRFCCRSHNCNA